MAAKSTRNRKRDRNDAEVFCKSAKKPSLNNTRNELLNTRNEILFYGDSLTFGMHHRRADRYRVTWPQLMEDNLHSEGYRIVESALCSRMTVYDDPWERNDDWMPGSEASDFNGLSHFGALFSSHTPKILVLALGTNDLKTRIRRQAKTAAQRLVPWLTGRQTPLDEARAIAESCARIGEKARVLHSGFCHNNDQELKIIVVTPPHLVLNDTSEEMGYDKLSEDISREFSQAFEEMCRDHGFIHVAKTPPAMDGSSDGVHFTKQAQIELSQMVWKDLESIIRESKPVTRARIRSQ